MTAKAKEMAKTNTSAKTPSKLLKEPYARILTPDAESGTYTAEILEFPGCVAQGDTPEEAYANLEAAAEAWIEAVLELGQDIPEPLTSHGYAGKIALRLPRSLHRRASEMAERDGTSLNQFLVAAVAERVGAISLFGRILERLPRPVMQATIFNVRLGASGTDPRKTIDILPEQISLGVSAEVSGTDPRKTIDIPFQAVTGTLGTFAAGSWNIVRDQLVEGSRQHA